MNDLQHFPVTKGLPADIGHDLFEGTVPDILERVIRYSVEQGYFTLEWLNEVIEVFDYDEADTKNNPVQCQAHLQNSELNRLPLNLGVYSGCSL